MHVVHLFQVHCSQPFCLSSEVFLKWQLCRTSARVIEIVDVIKIFAQMIPDVNETIIVFSILFLDNETAENPFFRNIY